jgi:hypothetical protein
VVAHWKAGDSQPIAVQYNPSEMTLEKRVQFAEIAIPGLTAPLRQFIRGDGENLTIELFFDTSDKGMGATATSVTTETDKFYSLARIEPSGHAPPPVTFYWGDGFPGENLARELGGQKRGSFTGVITSIRQNFTLFSAGGVPLRAKLALTLSEYKTLREQLDELNLSSPDRTHGHVLAASDQLWSVAARYYGRPAEWRRIAEANGIGDPRRLSPGTRLAVPSIDAGRFGR